MRLNAPASCPISSPPAISTVAVQSPLATRPALSASRCTGRVIRADAHQLTASPVKMPAAATAIPFHTSELSLRYRMTPHLELELLLSGGRQALEDGSDGELAMEKV